VQDVLFKDEQNDELTYLKSLDPYKFERLCAKLFEKMNLENVQYTQRSKDNGIDGFGDLVFGLVKFRVVFQAKRFQDKSVGSPNVRELEGSKRQHRAEKAIFITTSFYTKSAKEAADDLKIELID
jgi:restriction system protein